MNDRFVVISGCSGGGKSTLLDALAARGFAVIEEPGRRIVRQELQGDGAALPWVDPVAFARKAIAMAQDDLIAAEVREGWVFFDRGLVDATAALEHATDEPVLSGLVRRYHHQVFLAPPWPEIHVTDAERRHDFEEAVAEYERLARAYPALGYEVFILPKAPVEARANFVLATLAA